MLLAAVLAKFVCGTFEVLLLAKHFGIGMPTQSHNHIEINHREWTEIITTIIIVIVIMITIITVINITIFINTIVINILVYSHFKCECCRRECSN